MTIPSDPIGVKTVKTKGKTAAVKEPSIIIRPIGMLGGLDNLHITFGIVIALLLALLLAVSYSKPAFVTNSTQASNCTYGHLLNGSCAVPAHSAAQVRSAVERLLASYASVNGSLSVLPYFSNVSSISETYLPKSGDWYVGMNARNPTSNQAFLVSFIVNDSNLSRITPAAQVAAPSSLSDNYVASLGTVKLAGKYVCSVPAPVSVYWFVDPYASGSIRSLVNATALESRFGGRINVTVRIINGPSTESMANQFGAGNALALGWYLFCASQQPGFRNFTSNLNSLYSGSYVQPSTLAGLANVSRLNYSAMNSCIGSASQVINNQALLASYYNVTQTPSVVVDCEYQALPQTASEALCYADSTLC